MNPLTAICFIISGLALIILTSSISRPKHTGKIWDILFYILSVLFIFTGLLRFTEYLSGIPLSPAHLISDKWVKIDIMAPNTAFNFIAAGAAMLFARSKKSFYLSVSQSVSILIIFISLLTLIGYLYSLFSFSLMNVYLPPMALNSAIIFIVLAAGILLTKPEEGLMFYLTSRTAIGRTSRRMIIAAVVGPVILGWLRLYGEQRGLYDNPTGTAIYTWIIIAVFFTIIVFSARRLIIEDSARHLAEKTIAESENRLRSIIDNSPVVLTMKDLEGRFIMVNKEAERVLGRRLDELKGKTVFDFYPNEGAGIVNENDKAVRETGKLMEYEEQVSIDGEIHTFLSLKFPLRDIDNRIYATCGISTDITERKNSERNLHQLNDQLYESNKELESFSYSVSHDLRAPLRHIIGFGEKLNRETAGKQSTEEQRLMGKILASANKMALLIDDLLMFSRVGRTELEIKPVDMNSLFAQVIEDQKHEDSTHNIIWEKGELHNINGDPMQLGLVVTNLVSNAVKYTEKKEERTIKIGSYAENGETIFYVIDNGAGFDMRYADKLFGVFQRLHREDEYSGTGIGLATVRRIINRHGGRTWAEAELDKGASFYFSIPG